MRLDGRRAPIAGEDVGVCKPTTGFYHLMLPAHTVGLGSHMTHPPVSKHLRSTGLIWGHSTEESDKIHVLRWRPAPSAPLQIPVMFLGRPAPTARRPLSLSHGLLRLAYSFPSRGLWVTVISSRRIIGQGWTIDP